MDGTKARAVRSDTDKIGLPRLLAIILSAAASMRDEETIPLGQIQSRILVLRGYRVLLDSDLARFYGVPTSRFNEAVKRNARRFPGDFRFLLTPEELTPLISQIAISSSAHGGVRKMPWAFTEHGALMAANVLNSLRAVRMSVVIVRAFVALRRMVWTRRRLEKNSRNWMPEWGPMMKRLPRSWKRSASLRLLASLSMVGRSGFTRAIVSRRGR